MNLSSRLYWTLWVQKLLAADDHSDSGWYWSISCRLIGQGFVLVASFGSSVIPLCVVWAQRCFRAGMKVLVFSFFVSSVRTCGTSWWSMENLGVRSLGPLPSLTGEWSSTLSLQMLLNLHFFFLFFLSDFLFLAVLRFSGLFLGRLVHEVQMKAERRLCVVVSASALFALLYWSSYLVFDFLRPGS